MPVPEVVNGAKKKAAAQGSSKQKSAPRSKAISVLEREAREGDKQLRVIARFRDELGESEQPNLLGYVMSLGYEEGTVITNDFYKMRAGGLSKNSFVLVRPESLEAQGSVTWTERPHLILARVIQSAPTPLDQDVSRTYFELHKSHMPEIDVLTKAELQWSAMRISVLGTFYDSSDGKTIEFGSDVATFWSPHLYTVHRASAAMLTTLVSAFVTSPNAVQVGALRFTETQLAEPEAPIPVRVAPEDFIGARTALFGKTRMGKSNTVKIIAQLILQTEAHVGQVIFDPNGEYAYKNEQDKTSLYDEFPDRCVRYTLRDNPGEGFGVLRANFYRDVGLGMEIFRSRWEDELGKPPDYVRGFLEWEVLTFEEDAELQRDSRGDWVRYQRQLSIFRCLLHRAGFQAPAGETIDLNVNKAIRDRVKEELGRQTDLPASLPLDDAAGAYTAMWTRIPPDDHLWDTGSGNPYWDEASASMLTMLTGRKQGGGGAVSGPKKLIPFRRFHSRDAEKTLEEIAKAVDEDRTVIIDLSNASEDLVVFFSDLIARGVFQHQMGRFTDNKLGDHFVQFYFEEAHVIFPRDDRNLNNIYNRLVKEGAKLHIGVVYSTQSISTLSRDLLKNTENFFIAHLNDQNEINELVRFQEFKDVGADIQRTKTRGFVRMITSSHKFALPVQIQLFQPLPKS